MYLLFDIGGTKTRIALAHQEHIMNERISPTPELFDDGIRLVVETAREMMKENTITAVAGGVPGALREDHSGVSYAPNLPDWSGKPFATILQKELQIPVYLQNDAALAALGEAVYGAGQSYEVVAYLTISTGIGGARVVNQKLDRHQTNLEPGHHYIDYDVSTFPDMQLGTLEQYVSGAGILSRYQQEPEDIDDPSVWQQIEQILSYGLHNVTVFWNPDVIVLGGGLVNRGAISIENVIAHLEKILYIYPEAPVIKASELKDQSGLYGALAYLKDTV